MIKGKVKDKATAESEFKSLMDELQAEHERQLADSGEESEPEDDPFEERTRVAQSVRPRARAASRSGPGLGRTG